MITLHKILPWLLSPLFVVLLLMGAALLKRSPWIGWVAITLLLAASMPVVSYPFIRYMEDTSHGRQSLQELPESQAVVVLSGAATIVNPGPVWGGGEGSQSRAKSLPVREWNGAVDRFTAGVALVRLGKAPQLIFTGGRLPWDPLQDTEGDWLRGQAIAQGISAQAILVTEPVENTAQEALAVSRMLPSGRIILVTSAMHMLRARALFEARGLSVAPFPVDFQVPERTTTASDWLPDARTLHLTDAAWREMLGRLFYTVHGW